MSQTFSDIERGDVLHGRYRVDAIQHESTTAQWIRCTHIHIQRELLLIRFSQQLTQHKRSKQFLNQCRAVSSVRHRYLTTLFDYGISGSPAELYVVIEPLSGLSMMELLRAKDTIYPVRAYKIIKSILMGLEQMHHRQLVHQNLEWTNVFIQPSINGEDLVKVLTLGLPRDKRCLKCHPPEYRRSTPTPAFDVYMMGVLMIVLCMQDGYQWLSELNGPVKVPDELKISPLGPILTRALATDPDERYLHASQLLHAVNMVEIEYLHFALGQTPPEGIAALSTSRGVRTSLTNMPLLAGKDSVMTSQVGNVASAKSFDSKQNNPWRRLVYKEMLERAKEAYQRQLYMEAYRLFERCSMEEPNNKEIHEYLHKIQEALKQQE